MRGTSKFLTCHTNKRTLDIEDHGGPVPMMSYSFKRFDLDLKSANNISIPLFTTGWTRSELDFFDFDDSHVVYNYKRSNSFTIFNIKTSVMLNIRSTVDLNVLKLNDFHRGLLLSNDSLGCIR